MFLLLLIYNYYLFVREYVVAKSKISYKNHLVWAHDIYNFFVWAYHWKQNVYNDKDDNEETKYTYNHVKRILFLSNHQNLIDIFHIQEYLYNYYYDYRPIFICNKGLSNIWLFGNYIKNNHIVIENNTEKDVENIINIITKYKDDKIIVVLFPEGRIFCEGNIIKSNEWCKKNDIEPYTTTLCPRIKGMYTIFKTIQFDKILQCHISYSDDIRHEKAIYYEDYLVNNLPRVSDLYIKNITSILYDIINLPETEFAKKIYEYWKSVDIHLTNTYEKYNRRFNDFITYKHIYHDVVIGYNEITWNSSKLLIITMPLTYFTYGFIYFIGNILLLITSYQYHINGKWKTADIIMANVMISMSYMYNKNIYSNIFLTIGICFYIIEKMFQVYFKTDNKRIIYNLHSTLHMFAYSHIIIEFISNYIKY